MPRSNLTAIPAMNRIKVLHVVYALEVGGVEQFLLTLLKKWNRKDYDIRVCCLIQRGSFASQFEEIGIPVISAGYDTNKKTRSVLRLRDLIRDNNPDIVHCWSYGLHVLVVIAARLAGTRAFITSIQAVQNYRPLANIRNKIVFGIASRFIDCEIAHAKEIERSAAIYVPSKKLRCIYNGVDTERFHPGTVNDRARVIGCPIAANTLVVTIISRLDRYKDHGLLLRAADLIRRRYANTKFLIVGSGSTGSSLRGLVSALDLDEHVSFLGTRLDTDDILRASDIFFFAATEEGGVSVCLIEAMASAKPIVVAGCREAVEHGISGFSFEVGDLAGVVEGLDALIQDPALRARFGKRARERAEQLFSINNNIDQYYALYRCVLTDK